ncbi:response regulator [Paenibacillus filicis]|uniref:Response regulator n=1 Tax=Paenibacillus filicis TaxID=669464 RepID=A0ABU9DFK9_9BACL
MIKLIIVDDEFLIRDGLQTMIPWSELGIEVIGTAADGCSGWELVRQGQPHILLSDIRMPGMDGLELCRRTLEQFPPIKCILLTGHGEFEYAQQAVKLGAYDFVLKPTDEQQLMAVMERAVRDIGLQEQEERDLLQLLCYRYMQEPGEASLGKLLSRFPAGASYVVAAWQDEAISPRAVVWLDGEDGKLEETEAAIRLQLSGQGLDPALSLGVSEVFHRPEELPLAARQAGYALSRQAAYGQGLAFFSSMNHRERMLQFVERVDRLYAAPLTVTELSAEAYMSESYFSKLFKQVTGRKFTDYVADKRIEEAKHYLRETHYLTYEIAQRVGYNDQRYFSQVFKKTTGMTPSEYRRQENI